jgi:hypothetical protein
MSISSLIAPRSKISWHKGVATVVGEECMYVNDLNPAKITFDEGIPYSRIIIGLPFEYRNLPYFSLACGVISGSEAKTKKTIDKAYATHQEAFNKKWSGSKVVNLPGNASMLEVSLVPLGSLEGLSTIYSISPSTFLELFCSSVAYQVSRKGAIYYHQHGRSDITPLGKISFAPQPTTPSDKPIKTILDAYVKTIKELVKAPRKVLLFEPPIEKRGSPNYESYAFKSAMKDFPEVFADILSLGYVIIIGATESAMIDVMAWMATNGG